VKSVAFLLFFDSGILHALPAIRSERELASHNKLGPSWEGCALEVAARALGNRNEELSFLQLRLTTWRSAASCAFDAHSTLACPSLAGCSGLLAGLPDEVGDVDAQLQLSSFGNLSRELLEGVMDDTQWKRFLNRKLFPRRPDAASAGN
jgi:hypothetical protein